MISAHRQNRRLVLRSVLQRPGITRQALAQHTGLTAASITNIIGTLIHEGWVREDGHVDGSRTVGRPATGLRIATKTHYIAAVHLQWRLVSVGLAQLDGTLVTTIQDELDEYPDPRGTVQQIGSLLDRIIRQVAPPHLLGVGVGASGIVDYPTAAIQVAPRYGWVNVRLGEWLGESLQYPVALDNNARGMALAEYLLGAHRQARWLAFLYIGRGMGAGIWADGRIYRGARGIAGEIGHTTIVREGEQCWCNNRGCLELYLGEDSLRRQPWAAAKTPIEQALKDAPNGVREEMVDLLATALVNLDNSYNPEVIVVGGWIARAWSILREAVMDQLSARTAHWPHPIRVVSTSFGEDIGLTGAAAIGLGQLVYGVGEEDWQPPAFLQTKAGNY